MEKMNTQNQGQERNRVHIPFAVVGLVDIVSSSKIANHLDLETGWIIKERFVDAANSRATETGMLVLNHSGDGFLFIANYNEEKNWAANLVKFHQLLTQDFKAILASLEGKASEIESGLRFGVSAGPVLLGWLGQIPTHFTAVGPDVNLAARLCASAEINELVLGARVWSAVKSSMKVGRLQKRIYTNLKGFDFEITAFHLSFANGEISQTETPAAQLVPVRGAVPAFRSPLSFSATLYSFLRASISEPLCQSPYLDPLDFSRRGETMVPSKERIAKGF